MSRGENKSQKNKENKNFFKKFWEIVWKDDSFKGWLISFVFIFVIIKFVFFPLLSLTTGTSLPLAIVESCSMYHKGNIFSDFDSWWDRHEVKYSEYNINKEDFKKFNLKRGFNKGDIVFIVGVKPENLKVGDIIVFSAYQRNPIIHRIISIKIEDGKYFFSTIGDNNYEQFMFEQKISEEQIIGRATVNLLPSIGWAKLIFYENSKKVSEKGGCIER